MPVILRNLFKLSYASCAKLMGSQMWCCPVPWWRRELDSVEWVEVLFSLGLQPLLFWEMLQWLQMNPSRHSLRLSRPRSLIQMQSCLRLKVFFQTISMYKVWYNIRTACVEPFSICGSVITWHPWCSCVAPCGLQWAGSNVWNKPLLSSRLPRQFRTNLFYGIP